MYVTDVDQRDSNEYAEIVMFAIHIAQYIERGNTPFSLIHGYDLNSTLEAALPLFALS